MSKLVKTLNDDSSLITTFQQQWSKDAAFDSLSEGGHPIENASRSRFFRNGETPRNWIDDKIQGQYAKACESLATIPFLNEITEPFLLECAQKRVQYLCRNALPVWHDHFPAKIVFYFHRCIARPKSITREQMQIIHALAFAEDLATWPALARDDTIDGATTRNGLPAWHISHPLTVAADCNIVAEYVRIVLRVCVPDTLPTKGQLLQIFDDFNQRTAYYECFTTHLHMEPPCKAEGSERQRPIDIRKVTKDAVLARNYLRAHQLIWFLFEIPRLALCYTGIPEDVLKLAHEVVFLLSEVICYVDDLNDTPDAGQPLHEMTVTDLADIMDGDIQNHLFYVTLELARESANVSSNGNRQRPEEIWGTLQRNYGTGNTDDARKVVALYRKHNIRARVKTILKDTVSTLEKTRDEAVAKLNMPRDILWNLATLFVGSNAEGDNDAIRSIVNDLESNDNLDIAQKERKLLETIYKYC